MSSTINYVAMGVKRVAGVKYIKVYVLLEDVCIWLNTEQVMELQRAGFIILFLDRSLNIVDGSKIRKVLRGRGCTAFVKEPPTLLSGNSELHILGTEKGSYTLLLNFPYRIIQSKRVTVDRVDISAYGVVTVKTSFNDKNDNNFSCQFCVAEGFSQETPTLVFVSQYTSIYF